MCALIREFFRWLCGACFSKRPNRIVNNEVVEEGVKMLEIKKDDEVEEGVEMQETESVDEVEEGVEMLEIKKDNEVEEGVEMLEIKKGDKVPISVAQADSKPSSSSATDAPKQGQFGKEKEADETHKPDHIRFEVFDINPNLDPTSYTRQKDLLYRPIGQSHGRRPTVLVLGLMHSRLVEDLSKEELETTTLQK
ncbi:unnamed protein product [Orchesella dallaii]|uniref:Uncharacterized protein n=1 Tax=Orchesella dallaii TaxID=48710 RepID=A0ABP1RV63_9HEXA